MPQVWVIIVGYRNALEVASCITALRHQTFEDWGVIICENGGQSAFENLEAALGHGAFFSEKVCAPHIDAVLAIDNLSSEPCLLLHATENLGYAGAINACISTIRDKDWCLVWILNPDTEADPNALRELIVKAQSDHYGIVGSRLVYKDTALIQAYGGIWRQTTARGYSIGRSRPVDHLVQESDIEGQMDYILGASMLVTRDYIQDVGEMDDRYFLYCEEVDWCLRRKSYKLGYAHASVILHTQGTTIGSKGSPQTRSKLAIYLDERNRLLIARRFFPRRFPITAFVAACAWEDISKTELGEIFGLLSMDGGRACEDYRGHQAANTAKKLLPGSFDKLHMRKTGGYLNGHDDKWFHRLPALT